MKSLNKFLKTLLDLTDLENGKITNCVSSLCCFWMNKLSYDRRIFQSVTQIYSENENPSLPSKRTSSPVGRTRIFFFRICLCHWLKRIHLSLLQLFSITKFSALLSLEIPLPYILPSINVSCIRKAIHINVMYRQLQVTITFMFSVSVLTRCLLLPILALENAFTIA